MAMVLAAVLIAIGSIVTPQPVTIRIQVVAADRPVEGATVTVAGSPYITHRDGSVLATVSPGTVRIEVRHDGFLTLTRDLPVTAAPD